VAPRTPPRVRLSEAKHAEESCSLRPQPVVGAAPSLPAMTDQSRVVSLSKRTTDATLRPVSAVAAIGAISRPLRWIEVIKHTTRSERRSCHATPRVPGDVWRRRDQ
jgi:hypothetical protein